MSMGHLSHDNHVSQAHFSFSQGLVLRSWACMLLFCCLLLGYLLCRRVIFVTCFDRESCWLFFCFQKFLFWLENFRYCLDIIMWLFTIYGCGDYRQVWCVAFFSKTSILVVSFGLHQWVQLVDRISMCLVQLAFCSDCREVPRQRFLAMFSHSSPLSASLPKSPALNMLKLFYTRRVPMTDCGRFAPASPILPVGAWSSHWFPICREWVAFFAPWSCGPYLRPRICKCVPPRVPQRPIFADVVSPIGERGWSRPISPSSTPRRLGSLRVAALLYPSPPLTCSHGCFPKFVGCQPGQTLG